MAPTNRDLLVASTSTIYGKPYLEYLKEEVRKFFSNKKDILFIPYARPGGITLDEYTRSARKFFESIELNLMGIHEGSSPKTSLEMCDGIFTGGGNTFVLLKSLYDEDLMAAMKEKILTGTPYMGTSAGSNILGTTIRTTNDMPIVYPPSFTALGVLPFNINPHYLDKDPDSTHMGESRETRIKEFLVHNHQRVVGLREGSFLRVKGLEIQLGGKLSCRIFEPGKEPWEVSPEEDLSFLLESQVIN